MSIEMEKEEKTAEAFGYEWTRWGRLSDLYSSEEELIQEFRRFNIPQDFFRDKTVLDAGCGMGRYSYLASKMGAKRVIGIDISNSVYSTRYIKERFDNTAFIRGSILHLPFPFSTFDSVMSIGVLHHARDPKKAFERLVELLKPGGEIFISVYPKFNPIKEMMNRFIRKITLRIDFETLDEMAYHMAMLTQNRLIYYLIRFFNIFATNISCQKSFKRNYVDIFDWYSCEYQSHYDEGEISEWFDSCGLEFRKTHPNRNYFLGKKPQ